LLNANHTRSDSPYYTARRDGIACLVPRGPNVVLDLGCGSGGLGRQLLSQGRAAEITGVELFVPAAREAAAHYSRVVQGDVETVDDFAPESFDVVVCADILEHLVDPWRLMRRVHLWLKPGGCVVVSVPNVRFLGVIWDLALRGLWRYTDAGITDVTHLRFFTRRTLLAMLEGSGLVTTHWSMVMHGRRKHGISVVTRGLLDEWLGGQILAVARRTDGRVPAPEGTACLS
jgi:SAM-dependent methyltransferase